MEFKNTIEILLKNVKELEQMIHHMEGDSKTSALDMDVLKDKMRKMYEVVLMLEEHNNNLDPSIHEEEEEEAAYGPETVSGDSNEEKPYDNSSIELDEEPGKEEREKKKEKERIIEDIKREEAERKVNIEVSSKPKIPKETLSDKFKDSKPFMNEQISKNHPTNDLSSKLKSKPLLDINKAIGLNDKFLFINELFNGDSARYKYTIEMLNNAGNFNDAFEYIIENFDWDMDNEHVQKILELVRRKHISPV